MKIFWHRRDLRISACPEKGTFTPIYLLNEKPTFWLKHALNDLKKQYKNIGVELQILKGNPEELFLQLSPESVCWNIVWEPKEFKKDQTIISILEKNGIKTKRFNENYLLDPRDILNKEGKPYGVFTPFWNQAKKVYNHKSLHVNLEPPCELTQNSYCNPTRKGASDLMIEFKKHLQRYEIDRDFPGINGTSRLSPYLHYGQVSPKELYQEFYESECYIKELGWREFANYFLFHFPHIETENWNKKFDSFKWRTSAEDLKKWKTGQTGYPIVDAGMRELLETGSMHNRVRMIVASFLTKDLLIDWREGAKWFMEKLHDADLASNTMNWQWVSGCGPDAAPYFRIFNPTTQSKKFDKNGDYIKRYVPELQNLDPKWIHEPWLFPQELFQKINYPHPIIDHAKAREKALSLYQSL